MDNKGSSSNELVSPIPQRAYAFVTLFEADGAPSRPQTAPWPSVGGLIRPSSAPAGFSHTNSTIPELAAAGGMYPSPLLIERPASPLSRVANPMVRDRHFRRGGQGVDKMAARGENGEKR